MFEITCSLELFGKPEKAVSMAVHEIVKRVKLRKEIEVVKEDYVEAIPMEKFEDFYISSVELILKIKDFESLLGFLIDFGPSHVEIIRPHDSFKLGVNELENGLNDVLLKMHELDKRLKTVTNMLVQMEKTFKGKSGKNKQ